MGEKRLHKWFSEEVDVNSVARVTRRHMPSLVAQQIGGSPCQEVADERIDRLCSLDVGQVPALAEHVQLAMRDE